MIQQQTVSGSPVAQGTRAGLGHRKDIDGLRAIAIVSVIAYHCDPRWAGGGFIGVDIFFVISGYLIGYGVYRDIREDNFTLARFYSRRAKRILPALFGVLIFTYVAGVAFLSPREMHQLAKSALATLAFSSNIFFWRTSGYFAPSAHRSPLLMTWTLSVEEQFYLAFPLFMLLLRKLSRQRIIVVLASAEAFFLVLSVLISSGHARAGFFLLPSRAWEIGAGVLLAVFHSSPSAAPRKLTGAPDHFLSLAGLICILTSVKWLTERATLEGYATLLPVAGTLMVIAARDGIGNRFLSIRPIVFVGLISYSWYLWHWPLMSFAISSAEPVPPSSMVAVSVVAFAFAVCSWRFIEQPFRRSPTVGAKLVVRYATIALLLALPVTFSAMTPAASAFRQNLDVLDAVGDPLKTDVCHIPDGNPSPHLAPPCVPISSGPWLALVGDSHAAALGTGLRRLARNSGYGLVDLTKSSCPPLNGATVHIARHPMHGGECSQFNHEVLDYVTHHPEIRIVIVAGYWSGPLRNEALGNGFVVQGEEDRGVSAARSRASLQLGLAGEIRALRCAGKDVYLVEDSPSFDFDPVSRLQEQSIRPRRLLARLLSARSDAFGSGVARPIADDASRDAAQIVAEVAGQNPGVHLMNPDEALCSSAGCRFALGGQPLYVDEHHLSPLGARMALSNLTLPLHVPQAGMACSLDQ